MSSRASDGRLRRALLGAGLAVALSACASTNAYKSGLAAERIDDYDTAVVEYTKALRERPDDLTVRKSLERAKLRASDVHYTRARRFASTGKLEEAVVEFQIAGELNPANGDIQDELRAARTKLRAKVQVTREGRTQLETLIESSRNLAPPGLDLPPDVKLPDSLVFRDASARDVFITIGRFSGTNVIFDPAYRDATLSIELRGTALEDALTAVSTSTRNFFKVTAPRTVTIVPDTAAKRREYEEEVIRTFYLGNADLKETLDLLRIVVDNRRIAPVTATNAITIKDTPERVGAAARVISAIDKARAEVVIDVELLEVDRTRLRELGMQIASPGSAGISGSVSVNPPSVGDTTPPLTLNSLLNLTSSDVFLSSLPNLYYRLVKSDTSTRALANPQLRTSEGLPAQARFGERVPVPVTTFAPIAQGGVNQQPITSYNYENIGVNIDITPRIHHNDDVSLALKVEISNISGTGFGDLPTFGNRSITTTIRLRDGETNMLAGLIRDDERRTLAGVPGLSDLPLIGRLFAYNKYEAQESDIILVLTPHIVRVLELTENDLRPFRVGRESGGAGALIDLPTTPSQSPGDAPEVVPGAIPGALPGGIALPGSGRPGTTTTVPPTTVQPVVPPTAPRRPPGE
jgi:general secretion pathway protein D